MSSECGTQAVPLDVASTHDHLPKVRCARRCQLIRPQPIDCRLTRHWASAHGSAHHIALPPDRKVHSSCIDRSPDDLQGCHRSCLPWLPLRPLVRRQSLVFGLGHDWGTREQNVRFAHSENKHLPALGRELGQRELGHFWGGGRRRWQDALRHNHLVRRQWCERMRSRPHG